MTKIIFDKNLSTNKEYEIKNVFERVFDGILTASNNIEIKTGDPFPTIEPPESRYFTTVEIVSDGEDVPIIGTYNMIKNFSTQYFDSDKIFSYSIDLGYELEVEE